MKKLNINTIVLNGKTFILDRALEYGNYLFTNKKNGKTCYAFHNGETLVELNLTTISPSTRIKTFVFNSIDERKDISKNYIIWKDGVNYSINKETLKISLLEERNGGDTDCPPYDGIQKASAAKEDWKISQNAA